MSSGQAADLVIRGGEIVTAGSRQIADVAVVDGKISQIGGYVDGAEEIDARGKFVISGGIDMHVHMSPADIAQGNYSWADDFASGSRAAASGGVTTIGNMTFARPSESLVEAVRRTDEIAASESIVDYVLHPVLWDLTDDAIEQIPELAADGCVSVKLFMKMSNAGSRPKLFIRALNRSAAHGLLPMIHCEDDAVIDYLTESLIAEGKGGISYYAESRPPYSEAVAVTRAIAFARAAGARIYLVHVSSREAIEAAGRGREEGVSVHLETRPEYLFLTNAEFERPDGALYVGSPPLRSESDIDAMWAGLASGVVDTCCSDHAPWNSDEKLDPSNDIGSFPSGVSAVEHMLPLLFTKGVMAERITMEQFVQVTSTNAAKLFNLYPKKGTLSVGSDADIAIWDPGIERTVTAKTSHSNADYTIYEGERFVGGPSHTISRGEVIATNGLIAATSGRGKREYPNRSRDAEKVSMRRISEEHLETV